MVSWFPTRQCFWAVIAAALALKPIALRAQLVPDATLPNASIATETASGQRITGGTRSGANLFHSFREFSIPAGARTEFVTEFVTEFATEFDSELTGNGGGIDRIFSRVTGDGMAAIDGTLATPAGVSFYLIAPNGVVFGDRAQLDIGRDFAATTGRAIAFDDGGRFGVDGASSASLLSVGVPVGLGLGSVGTGDIVNRSQFANAADTTVGLETQTGQAIALVGRNINFEGGFATSVDGQIALSATETVTVSNGGRVDVSGDTGGAIAVIASVFSTIDDSKVLADVLAETQAEAAQNNQNPSTGSVTNSPTVSSIRIAVDDLIVRNNALISASTFGSRPGGTIDVSAERVTMSGTEPLETVLSRLFALETIDNPDQIGSGLFAMSLGAGNAGTLNLQAGDVRLDRSAFMAAITTATGNGGTLNVSADRIVLSNSEIFADTYGAGNGGVVNLTAQSIQLIEGGGIFASTFQSGAGGLVNVSADRIYIDGTTADGTINSGMGSNAFINADTIGGLVTINARELTLSNGAVISAGTAGVARGGSIILRASEAVVVQGVSANGLSQSSITTRSSGAGEAGDIEITTGRLVVEGGATISTSAFDAGPAGRLTVVATESIAVSGRTPDGTQPSTLRSDASEFSAPSGFFAPSRAAVVGAAGDMTLNAPELRVSEGAAIAVSSIGEGEQAGSLSINVDRLVVETGGTIEANTAAATEGNITINAQDVQLRRGARISGNATGIATGGNITIAADTVVGLKNSDITANAQVGSGGQVTINATGVLGLTFRDRLTPRSDITATSSLGFQAQGVVELLSPDVQLDQAVADIPDEFIDVDSVAVDACRDRAQQGGSRFTISARQSQLSAPDLPLSAPWPAIAPNRLPSAPSSVSRSLGSESHANSANSANSEHSPLNGNQPATPNLQEADRLVQTESGIVLALSAAVPSMHPAPHPSACTHEIGAIGATQTRNHDR